MPPRPLAGANSARPRGGKERKPPPLKKKRINPIHPSGKPAERFPPSPRRRLPRRGKSPRPSAPRLPPRPHAAPRIHLSRPYIPPPAARPRAYLIPAPPFLPRAALGGATPGRPLHLHLLLLLPPFPGRGRGGKRGARGGREGKGAEPLPALRHNPPAAAAAAAPRAVSRERARPAPRRVRSEGRERQRPAVRGQREAEWKLRKHSCSCPGSTAVTSERGPFPWAWDQPLPPHHSHFCACYEMDVTESRAIHVLIVS
ncbi:serine/arginine repetitive matrix protein 1-like isoform X1 [Poecile atricapillus]|uniref:serine/arginine repetitive matrix protein 1-like isoform X1 n=1 Tax=Poecile atricapillus TaxID=48891 RepID=UPI002738B738|nr:serine/arginine repetitive matrix protein 1-like isoform X1 [Poecile atricapillus]XP_058687234.1 serine/arginine repetitive matrix protein 1-like isoform X1 [Poecile atricapillus]